MKHYDLKELSTATRKVDKVSGKDLSSNDFNSTYKTEIDNIINHGAISGVIITTTDATNYTGSYVTVTSLHHGLSVLLYNNTNSTNKANATLNINSLGAKPLYYKNRVIQAGELPYRSVCLAVYVHWTAFNNGQGAWVLVDDRDTTYPDASTSTKGLMTTEQVTSLNNALSELNSLENHVHGQITNDGKIGSTSGLFVVTGTGGVVTTSNQIGNLKNNGAIGTTSGLFVTTGNSGVLTTSSGVTLTATFTDGNTTNFKVLPGS